MQISIVTFRIIIFIGIVLLIAACGDSKTNQATSEYDQLCKYYDEFVHSTDPQEIKLMRLTESIEKELPNVYIHYKNIALVDRAEKYNTYKKIAESETKKDWNCEVMKDYFAGKFD